MLLKRDIGDIGENAAAKYLKKQKYKILERNYRKTYGEIDIIAEKDGVLSFVEVKTRKSDEFGRPCEFVNFKKQERIKKTAMSYICENELDPYISFDIIEVYAYNGKIKNINHIISAFGE